MSLILLLEKLKEIELALEIEKSATIRGMLAEAEQYALQLQRESPEQMRRSSSRVVLHP
ncbi:MAG TPA: hypothetical protein VHZ28_01880 [Terracidiphilus sp.]|jgi:hypothetical protein|nr:hypothetical protein [Terracidiphilus sp.]